MARPPALRLPGPCAATASRLAALLLVGLLVAGCGSAGPTVDPEPTPKATVGPIATQSPVPGGPLAVDGPVGRGSHATPAGFAPAFSFDLRADGWRAIGGPDEFGFDLVTPTVARIEALLAVVKPVAAGIDAFDAELETAGLLTSDATVEDATVAGIAARSYVLVLPVAAPGFRILGPDGEIETSFGGELSENRFVYVAHPEAPFVVLLSLAPTGEPENRFVFQALVDSIAFR